MHKLYELKEMLCKELEEYGSKDKLDVGGLDIVDKLSHAIKNIDKIIEAYDEEEYSMEGGGSYRRGSRMGGQSGARGRGRNARRDSMGRYSSEGSYGRGSRNGGSYRGSYRGGNSYADGMEEMVESIYGIMDELPENVKKDAQKFVQKLEQEM